MSDITPAQARSDAVLSAIHHKVFSMVTRGIVTAAAIRDLGDAALAAVQETLNEADELRALFDLQREREKPWIARWQQAVGKPDTLPDYGAFLGWLFDRLDQVVDRLRAIEWEGCGCSSREARACPVCGGEQILHPADARHSWYGHQAACWLAAWLDKSPARAGTDTAL